MALPEDYDTIEVRGRYVYLDGTPVSGQVRFTGKSMLVSPAQKTHIVPNVITAYLDVDGEFVAEIPATDDPDIERGGWTYTVEEIFPGGGGRRYEIDVPIAALADGIDLSEVAPVPSSEGHPTAFVTLTTYRGLKAEVDQLRDDFDNHSHDGPGGGPGGSIAWGDITDKPDEFPPEDHAHVMSDVTGLADALDEKAEVSHSHSQSDVTGLTTALAEKLSLSRTFSADPGDSGYLRLNITYEIDSGTSSDIEQIRVNNVPTSWRNEVGFLRGTPHAGYKTDALVRGRARNDLSSDAPGGYIELENSSSQLLHRRRWRDGALVRGNGSGTIVCADVLVLGASDEIPIGTPTGTVIIRLEEEG